MYDFVVAVWLCLQQFSLALLRSQRRWTLLRHRPSIRRATEREKKEERKRKNDARTGTTAAADRDPVTRTHATIHLISYLFIKLYSMWNSTHNPVSIIFMIHFGFFHVALFIVVCDHCLCCFCYNIFPSSTSLLECIERRLYTYILFHSSYDVFDIQTKRTVDRCLAKVAIKTIFNWLSTLEQ